MPGDTKAKQAGPGREVSGAKGRRRVRAQGLGMSPARSGGKGISVRPPRAAFRTRRGRQGGQGTAETAQRGRAPIRPANPYKERKVEE